MAFSLVSCRYTGLYVSVVSRLSVVRTLLRGRSISRYQILFEQNLILMNQESSTAKTIHVARGSTVRDVVQGPEHLYRRPININK